jgi:radical SAM superfamily enzyme YgiQ (UPF0313 family)
MADYGSFFAAHAHRLQQANLYWPRTPRVAGNPAWAAAKFRALIVRLSPFRDVDRSTPHLFLADVVRRAVPEAFVDFAFFPSSRDRALLREHAVPWLTGIFSHRSAEDFDVILISNAYTLELFNLPALLLGSGIPPWARDRAGRWPPFILGGSNAMASQAILDTTGGSFVDAIFFGEGEGHVGRLIQYLQRKTGLQAPENEIPGLWLTGRWPEQPTPKATVQNPGGTQRPVHAPILNSGEAGTARLQINYGCPAFCTFCFEGYDRKPYREVAATDLLAAARELKRASGAEALELFSFNFNTHAELLALLPELNRQFDRVNMMSQRVDLLATAPDLLPAELAAGKRSFTLGIEGISTRLRTALHKSLPTADIHAALRRLLREKIRELKFFFLLTGDETADDFAEFTGFCRELHELCRAGQGGMRVMFSFGLLIRMPFTPLRHDRLRLDEAAWRPLIRDAQRAVTGAGFEFRLAMTWPEYAVTQMLALAPAGLAPVLLAFARDGFCYDQALPADIERRLRAWMQEHGLWMQAWLDEKPAGYPFALGFVRSNVTPKFLFKQFQASKRGEDDGFCLGGDCLACGACATTTERKRQTGHHLQKPSDRDWLKKFTALMDAKAKLRPFYGRFGLAPELAGATPEWLNAFVLRELLAAQPDQAENLLSVREILFTAGDNAARWPVFSGETIFALKAWDAEQLLAALAGYSSEKVRWLGQEFPSLGKDSTPVFQALEIELQLPTEFFPDAENVFQRWLKERRIAFSLRRTEHGLSLQLDPKKKTFLTKAELERHEGETRLNLTAGPAFDLAGFIAAFGDPNLARRADVVIHRIELR